MCHKSHSLSLILAYFTSQNSLTLVGREMPEWLFSVSTIKYFPEGGKGEEEGEKGRRKEGRGERRKEEGGREGQREGRREGGKRRYEEGWELRKKMLSRTLSNQSQTWSSPFSFYFPSDSWSKQKTIMLQVDNSIIYVWLIGWHQVPIVNVFSSW